VSCAVLLAIGTDSGETRGVWIATAIGGLYLVVFWRPKLILLVPVIVAALLFPRWVGIASGRSSGPEPPTRTRFASSRGAPGIEMIKRQSPMLGLGPDGPKIPFQGSTFRPIFPGRLPEGFYPAPPQVYPASTEPNRGIPTALE